MIDSNLTRLLERQHYKVVGGHSAVKLCHWTKKSILDEGYCYKQKFYGIESHRCLQMTPAVAWCTHKCVFCWRFTEYTLGTKLDEYDEPDEIIAESEEKHRTLLAGFGGIPERINKKKYAEAQKPNQAAISLAGEPTLYPKLGGLIEGLHKRGYTTFLVSNGTKPEALEALDELPTQLYISVDAPNKETYKKIDNPLIPDGWEKINRTLDMLPSINTKTAVRLTLVRGWNMTHVKEYARLIERASPDFVEAKAYMFVGGSRRRLSIDNMPSFNEIQIFSEELSREMGYKLKDKKEDSRVVLLAKD